MSNYYGQDPFVAPFFVLVVLHVTTEPEGLLSSSSADNICSILNLLDEVLSLILFIINGLHTVEIV